MSLKTFYILPILALTGCSGFNGSVQDPSGKSLLLDSSGAGGGISSIPTVEISNGNTLEAYQRMPTPSAPNTMALITSDQEQLLSPAVVDIENTYPTLPIVIHWGICGQYDDYEMIGCPSPSAAGTSFASRIWGASQLRGDLKLSPKNGDVKILNIFVDDEKQLTSKKVTFSEIKFTTSLTYAPTESSAPTSPMASLETTFSSGCKIQMTESDSCTISFKYIPYIPPKATLNAGSFVDEPYTNKISANLNVLYSYAGPNGPIEAVRVFPIRARVNFIQYTGPAL